jgi:hypothetical protein
MASSTKNTKQIAKAYNELNRGIDEKQWDFTAGDDRTLYNYLRRYHPTAEITPEFVKAILKKLKKRGIWPTTLSKVLHDFHDMIDDNLDSGDDSYSQEDDDDRPNTRKNQFADIYNYYKGHNPGAYKNVPEMYGFYKLLDVLADHNLWPLNLEGLLDMHEDEVDEIISEIASSKSRKSRSKA